MTRILTNADGEPLWATESGGDTAHVIAEKKTDSVWVAECGTTFLPRHAGVSVAYPPRAPEECADCAWDTARRELLDRPGSEKHNA